LENFELLTGMEIDIEKAKEIFPNLFSEIETRQLDKYASIK